MQEFLVFFGLTQWSAHSVVVGGLLLFLIGLLVGLVLYGLYHGIKQVRDCWGQPVVTVAARVVAKHYTPASSGTRYQYSYGYDPGQGGFGYRYGATSYSDPESFGLEVLLDSGVASFSVSARQYHGAQEGADVMVSGRRGRHSGRFYGKRVVGFQAASAEDAAQG